MSGVKQHLKKDLQALANIEIDQLCKLLLSADHTALVQRYAEPLKGVVQLELLFSILDTPWELLLLGIVEYTEKHGKSPDLKGVLDFMGRNAALQYTSRMADIVQLEDALKEVEVYEGNDAAVLITHVIDRMNLAAFREITFNCFSLATGRVQPAQMLGMKRSGEVAWAVEISEGLKQAQEYFSRGCSKLVGDIAGSNGLWHENTDAIVETLNEKAKGAVIKTLLPAMDDNWMLKLGKTLLIAGTSGDGKTTLMLTLLYNFALQGHNVVLFTLEDPQVDVWVKLAFIHTARFQSEFELPSLFEWEQRMAFEAAGENKNRWLTPHEKANMRNVICSIQNRDLVPGLIDVQGIDEWGKMKSYVHSHMEENKYSIMAVDYFGERMATPGSDPRWRDKELNSAAGEAVNFAQENNLLLVAPVQVKKNLRDAYAAEFVDVDPAKVTGFVAPYDDIAAVKADQIQSLPQGADYCIGVWSGNDLKKKNQGLICCMKFRPTVQFPCFRFKMDKASKYIRDAARAPKQGIERSIEASTTKYDLSEEL